MRTKRNRFLIVLAGMIIWVGMIVFGCGKEVAEEKAEKAAPLKKQKEQKTEKKEEGVVTLSQGNQKEFGVKTSKIIPQELSTPVSATAVIELNADRISKISPRISGTIVKVNVSQGDRVGANQPLAYLDSPEIDSTWADYLKARSRLELAERNLKREETLFEKRVSPEQDVLKARQELKETEADLTLAKEKFRILGIDMTQFEEKKTNGEHPFIPLVSSIGGIVIEKNVSPGEVAGPDKILFVVADLSNLWVVIDILEKDVGFVKSGMVAKVSVTAFPEKTFRGIISYTGEVINEKTRTAKARVTVDNSNRLLKPGMFATVSIDSVKGSLEKVIAIPEEAVLVEGSTRYVFVQTDPESFKKRAILLGRMASRKVVVTEGLKEGETIVTAGAFVLKSELKKEELAEE